MHGVFNLVSLLPAVDYSTTFEVVKPNASDLLSELTYITVLQHGAVEDIRLPSTDDETLGLCSTIPTVFSKMQYVSIDICIMSSLKGKLPIQWYEGNSLCWQPCLHVTALVVSKWMFEYVQSISKRCDST